MYVIKHKKKGFRYTDQYGNTLYTSKVEDARLYKTIDGAREICFYYSDTDRNDIDVVEISISVESNTINANKLYSDRFDEFHQIVADHYNDVDPPPKYERFKMAKEFLVCDTKGRQIVENLRNARCKRERDKARAEELKIPLVDTLKKSLEQSIEYGLYSHIEVLVGVIDVMEKNLDDVDSASDQDVVNACNQYYDSNETASKHDKAFRSVKKLYEIWEEKCKAES